MIGMRSAGEEGWEATLTKKLFLLWVTHNNPKIEAYWTIAKDADEAKRITQNLMVIAITEPLKCMQLPNITFPIETPSDIVHSQQTANWPKLLRQFHLDEFTQMGLSVQREGSQAEGAPSPREMLNIKLAAAKLALAFYADPYKALKPGETVPDFYSELEFGTVAKEALKAING